MAKLYILSFLAGVVAAYAVPLLLDGLLGREHRSPLRKAGAVASVVSGWVLGVLAVVLLHFSHPWGHAYRASGLFAIGALLMAVYLASWSAGRASK